MTPGVANHRWGVLLLSLALTGSSCTLAVANGFQECTKDSDCGDGKLCSAQFCLTLPDGCTSGSGAVDHPNKIALGAVMPLDTGATRFKAAALAIDEINQRDGVGGRPFAMYPCDPLGNKDRAKELATWLMDQLQVPAILSGNSAQTLSIATITVPRSVLLISSSATSPELTSVLDSNNGSVGLVWRTAASDTGQGKVIADLLSGQGKTRIAILYVDDPYGQGLRQVLQDRFGQGGRTVNSFQYTRGGDITTAVNAAASLNPAPQATVLIGFSEDVSRILQQAQTKPTLQRASGHEWFLTDSAKSPASFVGVTVSEIANSYGTAPAQGAGLAFASFRDRYLAKYGINPSDYGFTGHTYDATYLLALATAFAAGPDGTRAITGAGMAEGLTRLSTGASISLSPDKFTPAKTSLQSGTSIDVEGTSGKLNFNPTTGEAPSPVERWQVSADGTSFITVDTFEPPAD